VADTTEMDFSTQKAVKGVSANWQEPGRSGLQRAHGTGDSAADTATLGVSPAGTIPAQAGPPFLSIPAHEHQPKREVFLQMSFQKVRVQPPLHGDYLRKTELTAWVVRVWETHPPEGQEPLEWIRLPTIPLIGPADAWEVVQWYRWRWLLEDFHKAPLPVWEAISTVRAMGHQDGRPYGKDGYVSCTPWKAFISRPIFLLHDLCISVRHRMPGVLPSSKGLAIRPLLTQP
jgi:hypothetical protein